MAKEKTILSKQWTLQWRDGLRGLIMAVIGAVLTPVLQSLQAGDLTINWQSMLNVAIITGSGYILKNWIEPTKEITVKK